MTESDDEILARFERLNVWKRGGRRAPHMPLLLLWGLGRLQRGDRGPWTYREIEGPLGDLLDEFGPQGTRRTPNYPFWHLQSSGLWVVDDRTALAVHEAGDSPGPTLLRELDARGGFPGRVVTVLERRRDAIAGRARALLREHFPDTMHEEIARQVGLDLAASSEGADDRRPRDPAFREAVLTAYEWKCCVCSHDLRLGRQPVGLDAAHIMWHQAGGPAVVANGLALCTMHHVVFDRGAFMLRPDRTLLVSDSVHGVDLDGLLLRHHGRPVRAPQRASDHPAASHVAWHTREVFRGQPRDVA